MLFHIASVGNFRMNQTWAKKKNFDGYNSNKNQTFFESYPDNDKFLRGNYQILWEINDYCPKICFSVKMVETTNYKRLDH